MEPLYGAAFLFYANRRLKKITVICEQYLFTNLHCYYESFVVSLTCTFIKSTEHYGSASPRWKKFLVQRVLEDIEHNSNHIDILSCSAGSALKPMFYYLSHQCGVPSTS